MATSTLGIQRSVLVSKSNPDYSDIQSNEYSVNYSSSESEQQLLLEFASVPSSKKYTKINGVTLTVYIKCLGDSYAYCGVLASDVLSKPMYTNRTTWNTAFSGDKRAKWKAAGSAATNDKTQFVEKNISISGSYLVDTLLHPLSLYKAITDRSGFKLTIVDPQKPYLTVEWGNSEKLRTVSALNGNGYVDPGKSYTFRWKIDWNPADSSAAVGPIVQTKFDFAWCTDYNYTTEQGTWTTTTVQSAGQSYTIPANTFPSGRVYWKVTAYDGTTSHGTSSVKSFTTVDAAISATPVYPVSEVVDDSESIVFSWDTSNSYGNGPTASDLQWSTDAATWNTLATITNGAKNHTEPVSTFSSGTVYWRVRSYNNDDVAGAWSSAAAFILMQAPTIEGTNIDPVPFATVSWQSTGQQAYEVLVDGISQGIKFGTEKTYALPFFLPDGSHTIGIRVQNTLNLWSDITEISFSISNDPGEDTISLSGDFGVDADLAWTDTGSFDSFQVYRDDVQIGTTSSHGFVDRFVLGEHTYFVLHKLADGNYVRSSEIVGSMKTCTTLIDSLYSPAGWMPLRLTANDPDEQVFSYQRKATMRHFTGAAYPVLEMSKYEDGSGTYDVAFENPADAMAFEALKGSVVVIKSRGGNVVVGALLTLQKRVGDFFVVYDFTVQRIHWEDFVDDQNS